MAIYLQGNSYARNAGADLSEKLYFFAKVDTDGDIILCGDGEAPFGVIFESAPENQAVTIMMDGISKVIAGAAIDAGAKVASNNLGKAVTATSGEFYWGIALVAAGDEDEIISVAHQPGVV